MSGLSEGLEFRLEADSDPPAMVLEVYYAHPFQRPGKGSHFGFQLQPGW